MTATTTQHMITVDDYRTTRHPEDLLGYVQDAVRMTLQLGGSDTAEITLGWLARVPGYDVHTEDGRRWIAWEPGTPIPDKADQLACRGVRRS